MRAEDCDLSKRLAAMRARDRSRTDGGDETSPCLFALGPPMRCGRLRGCQVAAAGQGSEAKPHTGISGPSGSLWIVLCSLIRNFSPARRTGSSSIQRDLSAHDLKRLTPGRQQRCRSPYPVHESGRRIADEPCDGCGGDGLPGTGSTGGCGTMSLCSSHHKADVGDWGAQGVD